MTSPRYLTGDKEGIKEFLDKFDVRETHPTYPMICSLYILNAVVHEIGADVDKLLLRSSSSIAMASFGRATLSFPARFPRSICSVRRTNRSSL
jgi:hypothetical protein